MDFGWLEKNGPGLSLVGRQIAGGWSRSGTQKEQREAALSMPKKCTRCNFFGILYKSHENPNVKTNYLQSESDRG